MKIPSLVLPLLLPLAALAQETTSGIAFQPGTWKDVVAKAKAEKKLIFLDTYTTWCGPCKWMDKNVYPDAKVGEKFNAAFVNYKIDAEKGEGITLAKKYQVTAYPTYLFVAADESLVYRTIGSRPAEKFIEEADKAITAGQGRSLAAYEAEFAAGKRDAVFLKEFMMKTKALGYGNPQLLDAYLGTLPTDSLTVPSTLELLTDRNTPPLVGTNAFRLLMKIPAAGVVQPMYTQRAQMAIRAGIQQSAEAAAAGNNSDWFAQVLAMNETLNAQRPVVATRQNEQLKMNYYRTTKAVDAYAKTTQNYVVRYLQPVGLDSLKKLDDAQFKLLMEPYASGKYDSTAAAEKGNFEMIKKRGRTMHRMSLANEYNRAAWGFYETVSDKNALREALAWSKRSLELDPLNPAYADTYAHLLYKLGEQKEAVQWQQKALDLVKTSEPESARGYEETLQKMAGKTL